MSDPFRGRPANDAAPYAAPPLPARPARDPAREAEQRAAVVAEALSFVGTAYHHRGALKRRSESDLGGVDCAHLPYLVYRACGLVPGMDLGEYPPDWFLHQGAERYLPWVERLADRTTQPQAGDFVLYKVGRLYAHGAILVAAPWPSEVVHASRSAGRVIRAIGDGGELGDRDHLFFTLWGG